jgi:hypothetical protein
LAFPYGQQALIRARCKRAAQPGARAPGFFMPALAQKTAMRSTST